MAALRELVVDVLPEWRVTIGLRRQVLAELREWVAARPRNQKTKAAPGFGMMVQLRRTAVSWLVQPDISRVRQHELVMIPAVSCRNRRDVSAVLEWCRLSSCELSSRDWVALPLGSVLSRRRIELTTIAAS